MNRYIPTVLIIGFVLLLFSCEEPEESVAPATPIAEITDEVKAQFLSIGFDPSDLAIQDGNYLVEGDVLVSPQTLEHLLSLSTTKDHPQGEQFRTSLVVSSSYRTIKVRQMSPDAQLSKALGRAISNYNSLGLRFRVQEVPSSDPADISIYVSGISSLGIAKFPYVGFAGGSFPSVLVTRPGGRVEIGRSAFNGTDDFLEHVVTHELGHCLGMRHTDWYNRSLSCGSGSSEGTGSAGAVHIPGTPAQTTRPPDPTSIMNACVPGGSSGEFSAYDKIAWRQVY